MAKVHLLNIVVLDNPSPFLNPFQFEVAFECLEELPHDLEWKMIYVGSAESDVYDQVLDTIYVGPVPEGRHMFVFQADPPETSKIPVADVIGCTVVLLTCSYRGQEFVRVGYFTNNDYEDVQLRENPPAEPIFSKITRNILASQPRVTRFNISWGESKEGDLEEKENEQPNTGIVNENTMSVDCPMEDQDVTTDNNETSCKKIDHTENDQNSDAMQINNEECALLTETNLPTPIEA